MTIQPGQYNIGTHDEWKRRQSNDDIMLSFWYHFFNAARSSFPSSRGKPLASSSSSSSRRRIRALLWSARHHYFFAQPCESIDFDEEFLPLCSFELESFSSSLFSRIVPTVCTQYLNSSTNKSIRFAIFVRWMTIQIVPIDKIGTTLQYFHQICPLHESLLIPMWTNWNSIEITRTRVFFAGHSANSSFCEPFSFAKKATVNTPIRSDAA